MKTNLMFHVVFQLIKAIDLKITISKKQANSKILDKSVFDFLENLGLDFSPIDECDRVELLGSWKEYVLNYQNSADLHVENNGLCQLLACIYRDIADEFDRLKK